MVWLWRTAEDEAERMTHRIYEDPVARFALSRDAARAQSEHRALCVVDIVDADVEVQLLRAVRVRPCRRLEPGRPLTCELPLTWLKTDHTDCARKRPRVLLVRSNIRICRRPHVHGRRGDQDSGDRYSTSTYMMSSWTTSRMR